MMIRARDLRVGDWMVGRHGLRGKAPRARVTWVWTGLDGRGRMRVEVDLLGGGRAILTPRPDDRVAVER